MSKALQLSEEQCKAWEKTPTVNPLTLRTIKFDGPVFKQIAKSCAKYNIVVGDIPQPNVNESLVAALKKKSLAALKAFADDPNNGVDFTVRIPELKENFVWMSLIRNEFKIPQNTALDMLKYVHAHMVAQYGIEHVIDAYRTLKNGLFLPTMLNSKQAEYRNFIYENWTVDPLAKMTVADINILIHELKMGNFDGVKILIDRKVPFAKGTMNISVIWAAHLYRTKEFAYIVNNAYVNPNYEEFDGKTGLMYAVVGHRSHWHIIEQFINAGASIYAVKHVQGGGSETLLKQSWPVALIDTVNAIQASIEHDIDKVTSGKVQISSDAVALTFSDYRNRKKDTIPDKFADDAITTAKLIEQFYMYNGDLTPTDEKLLKNFQKSKVYDGMFMYDRKFWLSDEVRKALVVKCVKVGNTMDGKYPIYEIQLHHKDFTLPVGIIGNFIARLSNDVKKAAPTLADPAVIEKSLNSLHEKGRLLMKTFPYRCVLDTHVFDVVEIDRLKLNDGKANAFFSHTRHIKTYFNMIISIQAALKKGRYIPTHALNTVAKPYSKAYKDVMAKQAELIKKPDEIAATLAKTLSRSKSKSSKSPKIDVKPLLLEQLKTAKTKAAKTLTKKIEAMEGPIYDIKDIADEKIGKSVYDNVMKNVAARKTALNTIANAVKTRVSKLKKYYEDSMAYMDSLPKKLRHQIYRAVNGHIMQGPYSPIRRMPGGLLYAKDANAADVKAMIEVTMRAPRFPMRYTLYRGMALPEVPKPNHTKVYQELPFSTTFISNYALGWMLAKKRSACCLLEVLCHAGTGGLYLSKLPWLDPWTSMNSAIFQRIAKSNAVERFHIKVNSQNEFLMQPYRLKVVGQRKKNFKHMMQEQIEKLDTHYEYDAQQRGLVTLQQNNADLLEQEIDVYQVVLEPISVYYINVPASKSHAFEPKLFYAATKNVDPLFVKDNNFMTIFFSPEEMEDVEPDAYKEFMEVVNKNKVHVHKLIEKGKYVGPKTF